MDVLGFRFIRVCYLLWGDVGHLRKRPNLIGTSRVF